MTVIVYYRTPKRADLRQKSFSVREEDWESILRKTQNKSNKTFAQEQRAFVTPKIRFEVLKRDNFTCQYCGAHGEGVVLEVDHIIPISKGGTSDMGNLITACFDCNRAHRYYENCTDEKRSRLDDMIAGEHPYFGVWMFDSSDIDTLCGVR